MSVDLSPGQVIVERYRLEKLLGEGGMGAVWAATHLITHKLVALKFMHSSGNNSTELTGRFTREARAASAVRHPNVVEIHDVMQLLDGTSLMVMDMLRGETLADRLTREHALAPPVVASLMIPVVSAVKAAHAVGVIHRDLKPENIFLADVGGHIVPKVLDFGIAKVLGPAGAPSDNLTRTGSMLGTPYYMSPEQVFGEKDIDGRADIWSLGVILYCTLTGRRPFEGENFGQLLKVIMTGDYVPISQLGGGQLPPELCQLVDAMLTVNRANRIGDLNIVEQTLHVALDGRMTIPGPAGSTPMVGSGRSLPQFGSSTGGFGRGGLTPSPMMQQTPSPMMQQTPSPMTTSQVLPPRKNTTMIVGIVAAGALVLGIGIVAAVKYAPRSQPATTPVAATPTDTPPAATTPAVANVGLEPPVLTATPSASAPPTASTNRPHPSATHTASAGTTTTTPSSTAHNPGLSTTVPF